MNVEPDDFGFQFPDGFKWSGEMSRDELIEVIRHLLRNREQQRTAFNDLRGLMESFK